MSLAIDGQQVPGAVVGQLAQNLVADGRDTVRGRRGGDQLADRALLVIGKTSAPADRRH